ncbi:hypothetical protein [Salinibacterium amurskyense]|uniref:hypothetical protein n=1 Tax=Salinibacterium amurskyense TaxID=205941 RepID=UPI000C2444D3|nr:hypothetical protein [Salinibacterium amurskyense]RLQ80415.1 hypothetical protein D9C83_09275 [Salinibacterium amurskyense]
MRINSFVDARPVQIGYVVGAGLFAAVAVYFPDDFRVTLWMLGALLLLFLGPLALAIVLTLGVALYAAALFLGDAGPLLVVVIAVALAVVNVLIVRRWRRRAAIDVAGLDHLTPQQMRQQVLGFIVFAYAGCAFIVLCYVAGFAAIDGLSSGSHSWWIAEISQHTLSSDFLAFSTIVIWLNALGVALVGLTAWAWCGWKRTPLLRWAIVDFAVMLASIASISLARALWSVN